MDAKALAKSKRAHSLHHKKKHPTHQGLKAPSAGSDDKKAAGKQEKEQPQKSHGQQTKERIPHNRSSRALPSNWDRYDEELDLASEEAHASSSQLTESVVPKSKGADYAYLIQRPRLSLSCSIQILQMFYLCSMILLVDFGPMLAAKGQSILSWIADDSFEFESKASTSIEAPFLSINLNALAEQLAKAKLSERLYLQPDVLPLELLDEDKHDRQANTSAAETNTISSSLSYNLGVNKNVQQHREPASSPISATRDLLIQTSEEEPNPVKQHSVEMLQSQEISRSYSPVSGKPPSIFEAASAEAELDMLLNSFGETTTLESSGASLAGTPSAVEASGESMKKGTHMMKPVLHHPANIDDAIDNLLEETSIVGGDQISVVTKANSESISSSIPKSRILDDFDSWLDTI